MPAFAAYAPKEPLRETEALCEEIISLPMHPYLTPDQVDYICDRLHDALRAG
jgi:dTDP-4-amino-4,6-dideoxygalactose transaminase